MTTDSVTAESTDQEIARAGYVLAPSGRYVDREHGIDWAVILWQCHRGHLRPAPGPNDVDPPLCCGLPMTPMRTKDAARAIEDDALLASVMRKLLNGGGYVNWGTGVNPPFPGPWVTIDDNAFITAEELAAIDRAVQE